MNTSGPTQQRGVNLAWINRDLCVEDQLPLARAPGLGPCLCLYVYEPEVVGG